MNEAVGYIVYWSVRDAVVGSVHRAVDKAVYWAVEEVVYGAVYGAVINAGDRPVRVEALNLLRSMGRDS